MADPVFTAPSIRIAKTIGGFYRVIIHGPDRLQSQTDRPRCFEADIGMSWDKETALKQARDWFNSIEDSTPETVPDTNQENSDV